MARKIETNYCSMQLAQSCKNKNGIQPASNFYTASDNIFYANGKFGICKDCLKQYVYIDGNVDENNFKNILRIYDVPFLKKIFESAVADEKETVGVYMKNIYLNYKGCTWNNSDDLGIDADSINQDNQEEFKVTKDILKRWGYGFTPNEYQWLEEDFAEWCLNHESEKMSMQRLFQMICIKELEIRNTRQQGKATDKLEKSLMELMNNSNLTPRTMSAMNETDSTRVYGVWLKDIERYKPAEYFKDKKLYHDFDGIGDYFNRFVLRPMKNLLTGSRDFDKEFTVENEDEHE